MKHFVLHLAIGALWMLLQRDLSLRGFAIGFALGYGLLALFRPVLDSGDYVRRGLRLIVFVAVFMREYVQGVAHTLHLSLFARRSRLRPAMVRYDVHGLTRIELLVLTHVVSLTPGTVTVEVARDLSHVIVHALDGGDPDAVRASIDTPRRAILGFTR